MKRWMIKILICVALAFFSSVGLYGEAKWHKALFYESKDGIVKCLLCPRTCVLKDGQRGVCRSRVNRGGELFTLAYGNPVAVHMDPIEKKPFFHVMPGESVFSIAVAGCNMRCIFCQNWQISQAAPDEIPSYSLTPEEVVKLAQEYHSKWIVFTYTEPTIFYEYMLDIAKIAKREGLYVGMHSCGYINEEPLKQLIPYLDAADIDLKGFSEEFYNEIGLMASLQPVLNTLKILKDAGVWLEITNLVIPTFNDDPERFKKMCVWIREELGPDVPLHISRFYPQYKLKNVPPTPVDALFRLADIAQETGLHYVYVGNVAGNPREDTICPNCKRLLVDRNGYDIEEVNIIDGRCRFCKTKIPGLWEDAHK